MSTKSDARLGEAMSTKSEEREDRLMSNLQQTGSSFINGYTLAEVVNAVLRLGLDPNAVKVRGTLDA